MWAPLFAAVALKNISRRDAHKSFPPPARLSWTKPSGLLVASLRPGAGINHRRLSRTTLAVEVRGCRRNGSPHRAIYYYATERASLHRQGACHAWPRRPVGRSCAPCGSCAAALGDAASASLAAAPAHPAWSVPSGTGRSASGSSSPLPPSLVGSTVKENYGAAS